MEAQKIENALPWLTTETATIELMLALFVHLHDKGVIEKQGVIDLLKARQRAYHENKQLEGVQRRLQGQIDWLERLGTDEPAPPPFFH